MKRLAIVVLILTAGCGAGEELRKAVKSGAEFAVVAEPAIRAASHEQEQACLKLNPPDDADCVAKVRAYWDPIIAAYDKARAGWCAVDATIGQGKCP